MGKVIGIDLGTTNSCVAVMEGGAPQVIPNQEGARTTPSIVGFTAKGERLVGQIAKRQALTNPKNTVFAVKRLIGRKFNSRRGRAVAALHALRAHRVAQRRRAHPDRGQDLLAARDLGLRAAEAEGGRRGLPGRAGGRGDHHRPRLLQRPAAPGHEGRRARSPASRSCASSTSRRRRRWPTGSKNARGQFVAVYDLGGGTFDISILEMAEGLFQVRATGGDTFLGGEDFDQRIIDWLIEEFLRDTGIDLHQDRMALQRLKEAAEKAKCELSTAQQTEIVLPFISADASGPKHLNTVLTRQKYESLTDDLLERTIEPCRRCLADAGPEARPDRRGPAGRRPDARPEGLGARAQGLRLGAEPRGEPRRGHRDGRRHPDRHHRGRGQGARAPRRHAAHAGHRDEGRHVHAADRAQQHDPHPQEPHLHHGRGQPDQGRGARAAGRERHGRVQQEPGQVRADEHPARAQGRAADRGQLRDRRQRHHVGGRAGPGDRTQPVDRHPSVGRPQPVRAVAARQRDADARPDGEEPQGAGRGDPPARGAGHQHHALGAGPRGQAHVRRAGAHPGGHGEGEEGPRSSRTSTS